MGSIAETDDSLKISVNLQALRKNYRNEAEPYLLEENMLKDPFIQFDIWFKNVSGRNDVSYEEVNAVCLSTACENKPSSRMVLLKEYTNDGFTFYTNSISKKGQHLQHNPNAAMLFYWPVVNRQIRIEGVVEQIDERFAEEYWRTRPISSRIGSKLSTQSTVIPNRQFLEEQKKHYEELVAQQGADSISRPKTWFIIKIFLK